jgi:hypothetical protein
MGLFQRSMHGLHSSIHELEHYVHKIDNVLKQKLTLNILVKQKLTP